MRFVELCAIAVPIFAGIVTTYVLLFEEGVSVRLALCVGLLTTGFGFILVGILPVHTMPLLLIVALIGAVMLTGATVSLAMRWVNHKRAAQLLRRKGLLT